MNIAQLANVIGRTDARMVQLGISQPDREEIHKAIVRALVDAEMQPIPLEAADAPADRAGH